MLLLHFRKDPTIPLNFAVFLLNNNDRKNAATQFSAFESRIKVLKGNANPANSDPEVRQCNLSTSICIIPADSTKHDLQSSLCPFYLHSMGVTQLSERNYIKIRYMCLCKF